MSELVPRPRAAPRRRARLLRLAAAAALATGALLALPAGALAAPPANDAFADATPITSLPFSATGDLLDSSTETGEPQWCNFVAQSVWYTITLPEQTVVRADLSGSNFYVNLNVFQSSGGSLGGLNFMGCAYFGGSMEFTASPGVTYYLQVGSNPTGSVGYELRLEELPPPANDDFANAEQVGSLPFSSTVDGRGATLEPGEPYGSCGYQPWGTVWYSFTPPTSDSYTFSSLASYSAQVAVYTGSGVDGLSEVSCRSSGQPLTVTATAGTTYRVQIGGIFGSRGALGLSVQETPDPVAGFFFSPFDPSTFDTVQFNDWYSYDPGGLGISGRSWDFGDGTTVENQQFPTHRYTADGDYQVTLTVTTPDGRTGSTSQIVRVRTRDVAITKFAVPQTSSAGQTRSITVGVSNVRNPETVVVYLRKRTGYGWSEQIGQLRQYVPVRGGGRTTDFKFTYTFTAADAVLGKVTFEAEAVIENGRDALPGDNLAIALPTKVGR